MAFEWLADKIVIENDDKTKMLIAKTGSYDESRIQTNAMEMMPSCSRIRLSNMTKQQEFCD